MEILGIEEVLVNPHTWHSPNFPSFNASLLSKTSYCQLIQNNKKRLRMQKPPKRGSQLKAWRLVKIRSRSLSGGRCKMVQSTNIQDSMVLEVKIVQQSSQGTECTHLPVRLGHPASTSTGSRQHTSTNPDKNLVIQTAIPSTHLHHLWTWRIR